SIIVTGSGAAFDGGSRSNEVTVQGRVTTSTTTDVDVDACPAFADCVGIITNVSVYAPGLDLSRAIPVGSLVSVHYKSSCPFGCPPGQPAPGDAVSDLAVTNLYSWGGYTNATPAKSGLYLAVDDGGGALPEFPFKLDRVLLSDCPEYLGPGCGGDAQGLY